MSDFEGRIRVLPHMEKQALKKAGPLAGSWSLELPFSIADPMSVRFLLMDGVRGNPDIDLQKITYDRSGLWRIGQGQVNLRVGLPYYTGSGFEVTQDNKQHVTYRDAEVPPESLDAVMLGDPSRYTDLDWLKAGDGSKNPTDRLVDAFVDAFVGAGSSLPVYGPQRELLWPLRMSEVEMKENYDLLRRAPRLEPAD
jgi:hypothetical protein